MPHFHPKQERVTIISGTLNLGMADTFDPAKTHALTAGSYSTMPAGMRHFAYTTGVDGTAIGDQRPMGNPLCQSRRRPARRREVIAAWRGLCKPSDAPRIGSA
jgi:hypothetical protein